MHPQELLGTASGSGQLGDAQGRGVGDKDCLGLDDGSHLGKGLLLELHVLDHGLKDDIHVLQVVDIGGSLQLR